MIIGSCFWIHKKICIAILFLLLRWNSSIDKHENNQVIGKKCLQLNSIYRNISKSKVFFSSSGKCKIIFSNFHGKDDCVIRHFIIIVCCFFLFIVCPIIYASKNIQIFFQRKNISLLVYFTCIWQATIFYLHVYFVEIW